MASSKRLLVTQDFQPPPQIQLYKSRWLVLGAFSFLSMTNAMCWITFAPVATKAEEYFNVGDFALNCLSMVYMLLFIPGAFFGCLLIERKGLRAGLVISAFLNVIGAAVRVMPWPFSHEAGHVAFICAMTGQTLCSAAQCFILASPVIVSQNWFGADERVLSTGIGSLSNQMGVAMGFMLAYFTADIPTLLSIQAFLCLIGTVLVVIFVRDRPPSPPSLSASEPSALLSPASSAASTNSSSGAGGIGIRASSPMAFLFTRPFITLTICFGATIGSSYAVSTLIDQIVNDYHYSSSDSALLGMVITLTGLPGLVGFGWLADRTRRYKLLIAASVAGTSIMLVWFTLASTKEDNLPMLSGACGMMGFFQLALTPVALDLSVEITFGTVSNAGLPANTIFASAQVFGIALISIMTSLNQNFGIRVAMWTLVGVIGFCAFLWLTFEAPLRRSLFESAANSSSAHVIHATYAAFGDHEDDDRGHDDHHHHDDPRVDALQLRL